MKKIINLLTHTLSHAKKKRRLKELQSQFDDAVKEVENLMTKGDIKASGEALLRAEAIRKKISACHNNQQS